MFINNVSSRILAPSCPLVVDFILLPPSHSWPLDVREVEDGGVVLPLSVIVTKLIIAWVVKKKTHLM